MQSIVRQCFSITFHNREMCTTFEVIENPDTCVYTWHKQRKYSDTSQCFNTFKVEAYRLASNTWLCHLVSHHWYYTIHQVGHKHLKIPKYIKLADEQFDQPGSIDLLIGADLFYEMLRSGRRTRPGNYPVLGWTHTGRTPATTTQNDPQHTFLLLEDNSLEHNLKQLLGSGTRGTIHHDNRTTSLWTTLHHAHNPTRWRICC